MKKSIEILVLLAVVVASPAWAWTTVGSTGTVDDSDSRVVNLAAGQISPRANNDVTVRYNVTNTNDLSPGTGFIRGAFRFRDEGDDSEVLCSLYRYDWQTGQTAEILSFDSGDFLPDIELQTQETECVAGDFDFSRSAYYVACRLTEGSLGENASLTAIALEVCPL